MDTFSKDRKEVASDVIPQTRGTVINWGWFYDFVMWFFTRGNEDTLRRTIADLIQYQPGEAVLDVGCGTGSLTLVTKECVGKMGSVYGIDPAPRQIARARSKAARRGLPVDFQLGIIENLPFPGGTFDLVQSTFMIDHVPADLQRQGFKEMRRVLKPGGRLFVLINNSVQDLIPLVKEAGFSQVETGETEFSGVLGLTHLYFMQARIEQGA